MPEGDDRGRLGIERSVYLIITLEKEIVIFILKKHKVGHHLIVILVTSTIRAGA